MAWFGFFSLLSSVSYSYWVRCAKCNISKGKAGLVNKSLLCCTMFTSANWHLCFSVQYFSCLLPWLKWLHCCENQHKLPWRYTGKPWALSPLLVQSSGMLPGLTMNGESDLAISRILRAGEVWECGTLLLAGKRYSNLEMVADLKEPLTGSKGPFPATDGL